jgi:hypothetical protein
MLSIGISTNCEIGFESLRYSIISLDDRWWIACQLKIYMLLFIEAAQIVLSSLLTRLRSIVWRLHNRQPWQRVGNRNITANDEKNGLKQIIISNEYFKCQAPLRVITLLLSVWGDNVILRSVDATNWAVALTPVSAQILRPGLSALDLIQT